VVIFDGVQKMKKDTSESTLSEWKLVWFDEFDYQGLPDPAKWDYEEWCFAKNEEEQFYKRATLKNSRVEKDCLIIEAHKERTLNPKYNQDSKIWGADREFAEYTSASLITRNIVSWKYGRIEVRAKQPSGRGTWPAIWMLGDNDNKVGWPRCGEIDIMEFVGYQPDLVHGTVHTNYNNIKKNKGVGAKILVPGISDNFHIYSIEWDSREIKFFVDDIHYHTYSNNDQGEEFWPFDQKFYLILNLAIGGVWGGIEGIDDTIFPARFEVDYVRVYQRQN
jgi:beta-glucanase (GH16 family)